MTASIGFECTNTLNVLKQINSVIKDAIMVSAADIAEEIANYARALVPVVTGDLKRSIEVFNGGKGVQVGNKHIFYVYADTNRENSDSGPSGAGYEMWVEFGKKGSPDGTYTDTQHPYSTYPGANIGQGYMRLALKTMVNSGRAVDIMRNNIITQLNKLRG